jgi:hypothetical protein
LHFQANLCGKRHPVSAEGNHNSNLSACQNLPRKIPQLKRKQRKFAEPCPKSKRKLAEPKFWLARAKSNDMNPTGSSELAEKYPATQTSGTKIGRIGELGSQ